MASLEHGGSSTRHLYVIFLLCDRWTFRLVCRVRHLVIRYHNKLPIQLLGKATFLLQFQQYNLQNELLLQYTLLQCDVQLKLLYLRNVHHQIRRSRQRTKLFRRLKLQKRKQRRAIYPHLLARDFRLNILLPRYRRLPLANMGPNLMATSLHVNDNGATIRRLHLDKLTQRPSPNFQFSLHRHFLRFLRPTRDTTMFANDNNAVALRAARRANPTTTRPFNTRPSII